MHVIQFLLALIPFSQDTLQGWKRLNPAGAAEVAEALIALDTPCKYRLEVFYVDWSREEPVGDPLLARSFSTLNSLADLGDSVVESDNLDRLRSTFETIREAAGNLIDSTDSARTSKGGLEVRYKSFQIVHTRLVDRLRPDPGRRAEPPTRMSYIRTPVFCMEYNPDYRQILLLDPRRGPPFHEPKSLYYPLLAHPLDAWRWAEEYDWHEKVEVIGSDRRIFMHSATSDELGHSIIAMDTRTMLPIVAGYVTADGERAWRLSVFDFECDSPQGQRAEGEGGASSYRLVTSCQLLRVDEVSAALVLSKIQDCSFSLSTTDLLLEIPEGTRMYDYRSGVLSYPGTIPDEWPADVRRLLHVKQSDPPKRR